MRHSQRQSKYLQDHSTGRMDLNCFFFLNSHRNSIHGSAICAFNMTAINAAFNGPFLYQEKMSSAWERVENTRTPYGCKAVSDPARRSNLWRRYQLMDQAVQAATVQPLYFTKSERFVHIALDTISTKVHEKVHIIYASTADGLVKKLSVLPRTKETCVIELWQPEIGSESQILTMKYLKHTESLYIGTNHAVISVPAQHCSRHGSKSSCMNAMDPYCGWNELDQACTPPPNGDPLKRCTQFHALRSYLHKLTLIFSFSLLRLASKCYGLSAINGCSGWRLVGLE